MFASFLLAAAPLGAQDATTYLPLIDDVCPEALGLLADLDDSVDDQLLATFDALCRLATEDEVGNALVQQPSGALRGLRALLRDRARALPPEALASLATFQEQLVPGLSHNGPAAVLRRSPAA
ncbi:MAG: hypothetical protein KDD82_26850, partial [Planctomycetes bacterium]|nr:hypothetical protein [Planctomycetota bacterium]